MTSLEFSLGSPRLDPANCLTTTRASGSRSGVSVYLSLELTRAPGERTVSISAETSSDLLDWDGSGVHMPPDQVNSDGSITSRYRDPKPIDPSSSMTRFIRLKISE